VDPGSNPNQNSDYSNCSSFTVVFFSLVCQPATVFPQLVTPTVFPQLVTPRALATITNLVVKESIGFVLSVTMVMVLLVLEHGI
jgi:hypothetical protein